jgi:aminodeoxyfutalosine deaminase
MRVLRAKFVAPIASPVIEDGFVAIDAGRIVSFGRFDAAAFASRDVKDLGEVVLLPGLVNAHTHLEFSHASPGEPPRSFGEWLQRIVKRRTAASPEEHAAGVARAAVDGAAECLRFGVTTIGDISRECDVTRRVLQSSALSIVSFGEVQALAQRRVLLEERLAVAVDTTFASDRLTIGISPHAPYTVEPDAYRRCVEMARERNLPICTHLAESPEESLFLTHQTGPLRELWDALGSWDYEVPRWPGSPIELAQATGLLDVAPLLAHVNYATDAELGTLAATDASVVWCPRTHDYFGHPPHRWREMLARGINVCIGTDSRASSPDLNVVDDLRLVNRQSPEVAVETLWEMVTTRAARGLQRSDVGAIERGMRANLVTFEVRGAEPLREILELNTTPRTVIVGGEFASIRGHEHTLG